MLFSLLNRILFFESVVEDISYVAKYVTFVRLQVTGGSHKSLAGFMMMVASSLSTFVGSRLYGQSSSLCAKMQLLCYSRQRRRDFATCSGSIGKGPFNGDSPTAVQKVHRNRF